MPWLHLRLRMRFRGAQKSIIHLAMIPRFSRSSCNKQLSMHLMVKAHVLQLHFQTQKLAAIDEWRGGRVHTHHLVFTQVSVTCSPSPWSSMVISCPCMCSSMYNSNRAHSMSTNSDPWTKRLHYSSHETTRKKEKSNVSWKKPGRARKHKKSFKYFTTHFLNVCALIISNRLRTRPSLSQQKLPQMYINLIIVLFLLLHIIFWALYW